MRAIAGSSSPSTARISNSRGEEHQTEEDMTISLKLLKSGIVLIDPQTAKVQRVISLQYNPNSLSRTLQVQGFSNGAIARRRCA